MKEFCIYIQDRPGALASICETLARAAINIEAIATERIGNGRGIVHIVTNDEASTESILRSSHLRFDSRDILHIKLPDRPGELVKVTHKLARTGINIDSVYIIGKADGHTSVALAPNRMAEARGILKNYL